MIGLRRATSTTKIKSPGAGQTVSRSRMTRIDLVFVFDFENLQGRERGNQLEFMSTYLSWNSLPEQDSASVSSVSHSRQSPGGARRRASGQGRMSRKEGERVSQGLA